MEAALAFGAEVASAAPQRERADGWFLERIAGLVGSEVATYSEIDASCRVVHDAEYPGPPWVPTEAEWTVLRTQNPFSAYARSTGNPHFPARRLADVVDMRAFRATELYQALVSDLPRAIQMRMPGQSGTHWTLEVARSGRDYVGRDVLLLDALRPFLVAYEAHRALAAIVAKLQATRLDSVTMVELSARENEVLDLVATGSTNAEIAERLRISPGTVRKHLENAYLKLDVGTRTAALAKTGRIAARDVRDG